MKMKMTSREFCLLPKETLRGKVIVFPTDSVYGIGALVDDYEGQQRYTKSSIELNLSLWRFLWQTSTIFTLM